MSQPVKVGDVRRLILEGEGGMVLVYRLSGANAGVLPMHGMRGIRRTCDLVLAPGQTGLPIPLVVLPEKLRWVPTEVLADGDLLLQLDPGQKQQAAEARQDAVQALLSLGRQQEAMASGEDPNLTDEMVRLWPMQPENAAEMVTLHDKLLGWMERLEERAAQARVSVPRVLDWSGDNIEPVGSVFAEALQVPLEQAVAMRGTSAPRRVHLQPMVVGGISLHLELRRGTGAELLLALVARDSAGEPVGGVKLRVEDAQTGDAIMKGATDNECGSVELPVPDAMPAEALRLILSTGTEQRESRIISMCTEPDEPGAE